ncbi:hypothetical protein [Flavobacterium sp. UBA4197]|uniref:hypothetical protein n=1 Tax=Flavobacterium sp. UBA4197 TaxID=1946546 RepID=UPI00257A80CE|nr:hypothetical protein [Flavobacterium sp. UBA4197]
MAESYSSRQYGWNDITIAIGGRIIEGVTDIECTVKQDKEVLRGRGKKGHKILRGNVGVEGKLTVWQSELESMIQDAPGKDVLSIEFDIVWTYAASATDPTVTDIIKTCEFLEYKKSMKQGDKNMLVELPFMGLEFKPQQ